MDSTLPPDHFPGEPTIDRIVRRSDSDERPAPGSILAAHRTRRYVARGGQVIGIFLIAFIVDQATGQHHSNALGSTAVVASIIALWPWQRSILLEAVGYIGTWILFALIRAAAPIGDLHLLGRQDVGKWEAWIFGGRLPSSYLQDGWLRGGEARPIDFLAIAIHLSFFAIPTIVALLLLLCSHQRFIRYWWATTMMLLLAAVAFFVVPTAPPWLQAPDTVERVIAERSSGVSLFSQTGSSGPDGGTPAFAFDPNRFAALPSVHVAAAVLVCLVGWRQKGVVRRLGLTYAVAMSVSVVYLGEHYVIDALGGWVVALLAWWSSRPRKSQA